MRCDCGADLRRRHPVPVLAGRHLNPARTGAVRRTPPAHNEGLIYTTVGEGDNAHPLEQRIEFHSKQYHQDWHKALKELYTRIKDSGAECVQLIDYDAYDPDMLLGLGPLNAVFLSVGGNSDCRRRGRRPS